jgi:hypothetical protein
MWGELNPKSAENCAIGHFTAFHYPAIHPSGTILLVVRVTLGSQMGSHAGPMPERLRTRANARLRVRTLFSDACEPVRTP